MIDINTIEEHMEVVGSDGGHVGSVDNIGIKLTKKDPAAHGQHHYIKLSSLTPSRTASSSSTSPPTRPSPKKKPLRTSPAGPSHRTLCPLDRP